VTLRLYLDEDSGQKRLVLRFGRPDSISSRLSKLAGLEKLTATNSALL